MIVPADRAGERIDRFIASERPGLSRSRIQKLIDSGHVTVNGNACRPAHKLKKGDDVRVSAPEPAPATAQPEPIALDVVYEDDNIIVVNKPAGMVVHPSAGHGAGTLVNALLAHCPALSGVGGVARPGIVHRLDKDTSGLIVAAKNDAAHWSLSAQLKARTMSRTYAAVVKGHPKPETGTIDKNIARRRTDRKKMGVVKQGGRNAITSYALAQRLEGHSLLEVSLATGRTHQIRVHMLSINCPVAGDAQYARKNKTALIGRQALHAWKLSLEHPATGETMRFTAPIPDDMADLIRRLGGDPAPYLP